VWSIVFAGNIAWVLTDGGIARFTVASGAPQYVSSVSTPELSATGSVNPLVVDPQGGAWVASKRGLFRINPDGTTALYNISNSPIASDDVHSLALDASTGDLWIGTIDGLNRLRPSQLVPQATALSRALLVSPNPLAVAAGSALRVTAADGSFFAHAPIEIRDVRGRVVARLRSDSRGYASWNGTTTTGRRLPAGVYFVRIVGFGFGGEPEVVAQARLVLLP
jgi:ligand-binding sensor domain-containing protein